MTNWLERLACAMIVTVSGCTSPAPIIFPELAQFGDCGHPSLANITCEFVEFERPIDLGPDWECVAKRTMPTAILEIYRNEADEKALKITLSSYSGPVHGIVRVTNQEPPSRMAVELTESQVIFLGKIPGDAVNLTTELSSFSVEVDPRNHSMPDHSIGIRYLPVGEWYSVILPWSGANAYFHPMDVLENQPPRLHQGKMKWLGDGFNITANVQRQAWTMVSIGIPTRSIGGDIGSSLAPAC